MSHETMDDWHSKNMLRHEKEAMQQELDRAAVGTQGASRTKAQTLQVRIMEVSNANNRLRGLIAEVRGNAPEGIDTPVEKPHIMALEELLSSGPDMLDHFTNQLHDSIAELRSLII